MPRLANARHEKFAQAVHRLGNSRKAYTAAGYTARKGLTPRHSGARDACATKLLKHPQVEQRLQELRAMALTRHQITVDTLLAQLAEDRALAQATGQSGAAVAATMAMGKLLGLVVERTERGAPGDFQNLQSAQEVIEAIRRELGDRAADALAQLTAPEAEPEPVPTHDPPEGRQ
jgi:hypothetical protein